MASLLLNPLMFEAQHSSLCPAQACQSHRLCVHLSAEALLALHHCTEKVLLVVLQFNMIIDEFRWHLQTLGVDRSVPTDVQSVDYDNVQP